MMEGFSNCFLPVIYLCSLPVMKKKLIVIVLFLFFLSTVGVPISLHFCGMQGSFSFSDCDMCVSEVDENDMSCCERDNHYSVEIKTDNSNQCCETRIIEPSVKGDFLLAVNNLQIKVQVLAFLFITDNLHSAFAFRKNQFAFSDSSPPLISKNIYLLNSVLLI